MIFLVAKILLLALLQIKTVSTFQNCPLLGPVFPPPVKLDSSTIQNANSALTNSITAALANGQIDGSTTSFSIAVFSPHSTDTLFTYHHSAPNLNGSQGVTTVDSNSIYRIASISKLFTVFTVMVEDGDIHFNDPVTKYIPELRAAASSFSENNALNAVDWNSITVGNLASQLSGTQRDYYDSVDELPGVSALVGLPPLNSSEENHCTFGATCARNIFFQDFVNHLPVFGASRTPMYDNVAYQLLAYALEGIAGKPFEDILEAKVLKKLQLNSTSYLQPNTSKGVIPGTPGIDGSWWNIDFAAEGRGANMYSSLSDLVRFGKAILASELLSPAQTRRWMKPSTHTSNLQQSVGAPWEILRAQLEGSQRIVDLYTKAGNIGAYNSEIALVPDWDLGFVVLSAGGSFSYVMSDLISKEFFPAFETAAREEANANYAGHYASSDPTLNTSITFTTDIHPGLAVTSAITNGTNLFTLLAASWGYNPSETSMRMYPTGLKNKGSNEGTEIGWVMIFESTAATTSTGPFTMPCSTWGNIGLILYGGVALEQFAFIMGSDGIATSVVPQILRTTLQRV